MANAARCDELYEQAFGAAKADEQRRLARLANTRCAECGAPMLDYLVGLCSKCALPCTAEPNGEPDTGAVKDAGYDYTTAAHRDVLDA